MKKYLPFLLMLLGGITVSLALLVAFTSPYRFIRRSPVDLSNSYETTARLDELLGNLRASSGYRGILCVTRRGKPLFSRATDVAITPDTRFHLTSLAMQFTAYGVYRLLLQDKIKPDQPVRHYLPELGGSPAGNVTIRQLLDHTSGLPLHFPVAARIKGMVYRNHVFGTAEVVALVKKMKVVMPRDSTFSYSEVGYALLAHISQRCAGIPWPQLMKQEVFDRAGMTCTSVPNPGAYIDKRGPGHLVFFSGSAVVPVPAWNHSLTFGADGIYSTANDLLKWDRFIQDQEGDYLSSIVFGSLQRRDQAYAGGFVVSGAKDGGIVLRHEGFEPGYRCGYAILMDQEVSVILLSSTTPLVNRRNQYSLFHEVLRVMHGREHWIRGKN